MSDATPMTRTADGEWVPAGPGDPVMGLWGRQPPGAVIRLAPREAPTPATTHLAASYATHSGGWRWELRPGHRSLCQARPEGGPGSVCTCKLLDAAVRR